MKIKEIAFTVYAVTDMPKARAFYEGVLGLKTNDEFNGKDGKNANWIEYDVAGQTFGIGCSPEWKPSSDGASIAFNVDDFDGTVKELKTKGVPFFMEPMEFPTCHMTVITDPDGNKIVIHKKK